VNDLVSLPAISSSIAHVGLVGYQCRQPVTPQGAETEPDQDCDTDARHQEQAEIVTTEHFVGFVDLAWRKKGLAFLELGQDDTSSM